MADGSFDFGDVDGADFVVDGLGEVVGEVGECGARVEDDGFCVPGRGQGVRA